MRRNTANSSRARSSRASGRKSARQPRNREGENMAQLRHFLRFAHYLIREVRLDPEFSILMSPWYRHPTSPEDLGFNPENIWYIYFPVCPHFHDGNSRHSIKKRGRVLCANQVDWC
jgi:hypothetical protein